jgi:hypothetical protein
MTTTTTTVHRGPTQKRTENETNVLIRAQNALDAYAAKIGEITTHEIYGPELDENTVHEDQIAGIVEFNLVETDVIDDFGVLCEAFRSEFSKCWVVVKKAHKTGLTVTITIPRAIDRSRSENMSTVLQSRHMAGKTRCCSCCGSLIMTLAMLCVTLFTAHMCFVWILPRKSSAYAWVKPTDDLIVAVFELVVEVFHLGWVTFWDSMTLQLGRLVNP